MNERLIRQHDLLQPTELDIHIVGCGGIGSWTTLAIAKMGYKNITVYDFDSVEDHNVATQFFRADQVGCTKAQALSDNVMDFTGTRINIVSDRPDNITGDVLIMAVDTMASREELKVLIPNFQFIVDTRMGGQVFNIWSFLPFEADRYEGTLFTDEEGVQEPCTARAIAYNVFGIASMIGNLVKRYDRNEPMPFELNGDYVNLRLDHTKF